MIKSRRISTQFELESTFFVIMKTNNGQVNSPLLHYLHAVLSVSLLHPLDQNERLIEQFVDEDGVIILHRLYYIVFSRCSSAILASFTSTLFHILPSSCLLREPSLAAVTSSSKAQIGRPAEEGKVQTQSASEFFTLLTTAISFLLKENDQKAESSTCSLADYSTSLTASPPLRLFNPRPYLRMSIVRQPTPATPQQFTAGRSTSF
ncbi:hypothetical protein BLNAU_23982 [Blattamonas nauphoetae]|uniref:Uncharacterized protein n=1 Tax=Blattamonas nauphoetae TaxID=2049346 RepID=A0ABQ9WNN9_9EUKA|nr:hypothetical protein BLNAU_23982 [Blattamonas nauphoetae]